MRVLETCDFKTSKEVLRFETPTFARSFDLLGGDFYFGLGCEIDKHLWSKKDLHPATGEIFRVKAEHFTFLAGMDIVVLIAQTDAAKPHR